MFLTKHEEQMLAGEYGVAVQLAMEILTKIGDMYKAEKMIEIASAHTVMTPYRDIMDAGVEICEKFAELGGKYLVRARAPDFVAVGCPHYSIKEIGRLANFLRARKN